MDILFLSFIVGGVLGIVLTYVGRNKDVCLDVNIRDKIRELPQIFERAQRTIKIATDFDKRFFDTKEVKGAIKEAVEKGMKVRFISEGDPPRWYENQRKSKKLEIKRVRKLSGHVMIIDSRHIRIERPHPSGEFGDRKEDVAFIIKDSPKFCREYDQKFDEIWERLH